MLLIWPSMYTIVLMFIPELMRMRLVLHRCVHAKTLHCKHQRLQRMLSISSNGHKKQRIQYSVFQQLHIMARISSHVINHLAIFFSFMTRLLLGILVAAILKTGCQFGFNVLTYDLLMIKYPMKG